MKIIFVLGVALGLADAVSRSLFCQVSKVTEVDLQFDTVGLTIGQWVRAQRSSSGAFQYQLSIGMVNYWDVRL